MNKKMKLENILKKIKQFPNSWKLINEIYYKITEYDNLYSALLEICFKYNIDIYCQKDYLSDNWYYEILINSKPEELSKKNYKINIEKLKKIS